ncbi:uncharacterized protein LOC114305417 isoform X2 [Camellia sinensis]|uniref:uncharacterized protein LOC114305417 isoform X2 n=1 Tax=Camellia sinensis TaxID=4442 RepID=UPI00103562D4|nr:uncharacterized protein LOC114305417 isoform X2 [Camellia sinensis]
MEMMGLCLSLVMVMVTVMVLLPLCHGDGLSISTQNLEVSKQLKRLNKPPLKSIKSPDGDIIDCVHISHQPAFDHPLFKNHTIQKRPNYHPLGQIAEKKVSNVKVKSNGGKSTVISQLWHTSGRCPEGTIPIRRTRREDLLRASSITSYGKKKHKTIPKPAAAAAATSANPDIISQSGHQHAIAYVEGDKYYGAKGTMNVWEPRIDQPNEFSLSQLWILGGSFASDLNSIEAGWQVSPDLYGDHNTRLFTYWTDPKEGNWWMQFGSQYVLGYWPSYLFSYLADSASMIEWGGEVVNSASDGQHTTTQMGSGHFPGEGFGKSSYFRNIEIVDGSNNLRAPKDISTFTEQSNCYDVQTGKNGDWGNYFYYGGPGRNPNCP